MNRKPTTFIPNRIGIMLSAILFGIPALLSWVATDVGVTALLAQGWNPLLAWFLAGTFVFAPLLVAAIFGASKALSTPSLSKILQHLRVRRLSFDDWQLTSTTLVWTVVAVAGLIVLNAKVWPGLPTEPSFMPVQPLAPAQYYLIVFWLPFFAVNIMARSCGGGDSSSPARSRYSAAAPGSCRAFFTRPSTSASDLDWSLFYGPSCSAFRGSFSDLATRRLEWCSTLELMGPVS